MEYKKLDKKTFFKGLRGELTLEEIEKLPKEYDYYKELFKNIFERNKAKEMFENTDEELVAKGFSGELTHEEIDNLPKEYDKFKETFHEWTTFMSHDNGNSKIKTTLREFEVAKRIVDTAPNSKKGVSRLKEIFKIRKGIKNSRNMGSIYDESDVTPQSEIEKMLVPSPGDASDPDWAHKCAINNVLNCKPNIPKENIITKIKNN